MNLRRFQLDTLRKITSIPGVHPSLLLIDGASPKPSTFGGKIRTLLRGKNTFWPIYQRLVRLEQGSPLEIADATAELERIPQITCTVQKKGKYSEYFSAADIDTIREHNLDFILKFAFGIIRGDILTAARYGVWSFHHDDPERYRGIPPGFWEIYYGDPVSGVILQRLNERLDGGVVLRKYFVKTAPYSYKQNLSNVMNASMDMPATVCKDLLQGHDAYLSAPPCKTDAPIFKNPSNWQVCVFALRCAKRWAHSKVDGLIHSERWDVGIVDAPIERFLEPGFRPNVKWLPFRRPKEFIADPFVEKCGGSGVSIVAERYDQDNKCGYIVRIRSQKDGTMSMETILQTGSHMSYPYIVSDGGVQYLIPESCADAEVTLYRIEDDGTLSRVATLVKNFAGVDATVVRHEGRWWMFATDAEGAIDANLYVWYATDLTGPWEPHPANPVKVDVRSCRPAGTPFHHKGQLYRPAQNCSRTYGGSTTINRIVRLTPVEFLEETVCELHHDPASPYRGFHTLSAGDGFTLVDGRHDEINPEIIWRKLTGRLRRLVTPNGNSRSSTSQQVTAAGSDR
jgi:hypothetical protein